MQIIELLAINQQRFTKILILETKDQSKNPAIDNIKEKHIFNSMDQVSRDFYEIEANDYFLLDKEGLEHIVYTSQNLDLDIEEDDRVLVILI